MWSFKVCNISYLFPLILNNLIELSTEQETKIPEFNWIIKHTGPLCSLIIKSGLYVSLLYIIIDPSKKPETNLHS